MNSTHFTHAARVTTADKDEAPERIFDWLDSHLSIARFYGGITFNGHSYTIAPNEPGCPLVRFDVLAREAQEREAAAKAARQAIAGKQGDLL